MAYPSRARAVPILLLPLLAGAACGDKKTPPNLNELVSRLATALCTYEVACDLTPDMASCLGSTFQNPDEIPALEADIASGKTLYDAAKAGACIAWFERYYGSSGCTASSRDAVGLEGEEVCAEMLVGTIAPGGACFASTQCAGGGLCQPTDAGCALQCCPGTCVAPAAPLPVGADCSTLEVNQSCAEGSFCLAATPGGPLVCTIPSTTPEGSPCSTIYACASPLFCDMPSSTGTGTCRRKAASGAACNSIVASYLSCDDIRDTCDAATNTCVRRTAVGGTCDAARYPCVAYALCQLGTCVAYTKPGAACTPGATPDCLGSLECSTQTNTCVAPSSDGSCI